jgi:hypothetical protein
MISLQVGGDLASIRVATTMILVNEMNVGSLPEY